MTTERRMQIVYACIFGVVGVVGVRYSDLWVGVLFLVLAALFFVGVSKRVEDFVTNALLLVVAVGFVVESAVESVLARSILAATALVMLLLAVGWLLTHAKRNARA